GGGGGWGWESKARGREDRFTSARVPACLGSGFAPFLLTVPQLSSARYSSALCRASPPSSSPQQPDSPKGVLSLQFDLVQVQRPRFGQLGRGDVEALDTGQVERGELLSGSEVLKVNHDAMPARHVLSLQI